MRVGEKSADLRIGLRLAYDFDSKFGRLERIEHGMKRSMPKAHRYGLVSTLPDFVETIGLEIVVLAGEYMIHEGMMRGEDQAAAVGQHAPEFRKGPRPIRQIVHNQRGDDQVEAAVQKGQRLVQVGQQQSRASVQAALRDPKQAHARIDARQDRATIDESACMCSAAAACIEDPKSGDISGQRKNGRALILGVPGIVLVVGLIGGRERIVVIFGQSSSSPRNGTFSGIHLLSFPLPYKLVIFAARLRLQWRRKRF